MPVRIRGQSRRKSAIAKFESAVDAVVAGDAAKLKRLLKENPGLVRERSAFPHRATLLHYVGANGVESYRQKTPKNSVRIAMMLLKAGADIHAVADLYGGSDTLGLAATSVWPFLAGVQNALMDVLIQHGADLRHAKLVNACLANGRGRAAEHLAKRGAALDLEGAAGIGRLDLVKTFFKKNGSLKKSATKTQMERGFAWACEYGHTSVVKFLLEAGLKPDVTAHRITGLHWAAYTARVEIVKLLLGKNAPLELRDERHNGTPLGWALHGWENSPSEPKPAPRDYPKVVRLLTASGATVNSALPADLRRRRALMKKIRGDVRMVSALKGNANSTQPDYAARRRRIFGNKILPNMVLVSREGEG